MAVAVEIIGTGNRSNRPDEVNLPRLMAPVKFQDHGMILIEIGFRAAEPGVERRHHGSVEPFVGMKHDGQHAIRVGAVENRLVHRGLSLARKNLADVGDPRQSLASCLAWTDRVEGLGRFRSLIQRGAAKVNGDF